jgi:DNA-binding Xre family transcriptional regulator
MEICLLDRKLAAFLRAQRGTSSYAEFGRRLDMSKSMVYNLENHWRSASLKTLEQICRKLKVSPADILGTEVLSRR